MTLMIELPDNLDAALKAQAHAQGVSEARFVRQLLAEALTPETKDDEIPGQPFETGRGMLAKYGSAPSTEEIDENRRDMFRNFAQDL